VNTVRVPHTRTRHTDERGSVTVFTALVLTTAILGAGLALDLGQALTAKTDTIAQAQQAARAGAAGLDTRRLRSGTVAVIDPAALAAIHTYLRSAGDTGSATITGPTITVTAHRTVTLRLLDLFGLGHKTVSGTGTARIEPGINAPYDLDPSGRPQAASKP
jgi:hypothetical protein